MASFNVFNCFPLDLGRQIHSFSSDVLKMVLTNVAPSASADAVLSDITDLSTGGGYTAGGVSIGTNVWSQSGGIATLAPGTNPAWTATSGFGPFRYGVLYNFTATAKNLICFWDNGTSQSVTAGAPFSANFGSAVFNFHF